MGKRRKPGFITEHSMSIVSVAILGVWILLYSRSREETHLGSFFGNAIADWSGVVMTVIGTKYFCSTLLLRSCWLGILVM